MPRGKTPSGIDTDGRNRPNRKQGRAVYKQRAEFSGWVNLTIPAADKAKVDEYNASAEYAHDFHDLVQGGHKITLAWDSDNECFVATTFMTDPEHACAGLMVSQRSSDLWRALVKLVYGHSQLLPPDYSDLAGNGGNDW